MTITTENYDMKTRVELLRVSPFIHLPSTSRLGDRSKTQPTLARRVVFLDRDGVIVEDVHFLKTTKDIKVLPEASDAIRSLMASYFIIVVTNQSGIARGYFTEETLFYIHVNLLRSLRKNGAYIDALLYCPHLPDAPLAQYDAFCDCRKPAPGMIARATAKFDLETRGSFMIGDSARDVQAGTRAGLKSILLGDGQAAPEDYWLRKTTLAQAAAAIFEENP